MSITEFLLARFAEDESVALAATPGPWSFADEHGLMPEADPAWCISQMRPGYETMSDTEGYIGDIAEVWCDRKDACPDAEHITRWNPARVIAQCEANRLVLVWHQQYNSTGCGGDECHGLEDQCPTLRALALPYVDHPDWREEWRT